MSKKTLKIITYLYLMIPIAIFIVGWVKIQFALFPMVFLVVLLLKKVLEKEEKERMIDKKACMIIFVIIMGICFLGGIGGMFYQSSDWHYRNAIFRDLVNKDWPVFYENADAALSYYIGIWMVPAMMGKAILSLAGADLAWRVANVALWFWCATGITLTILWLVKDFQPKNLRKIFLIMFLFLGFSGLDFIGVFLQGSIESINEMHLEWWASYFQYSSMMTQIFWVFNQSIVAWLITVMFIQEKNVKQYLFLILLCFTYSPLPFLGLIPLMGVRGIKYLIQAIQEKKISQFVKEVFSIENVLALLAIFPIYSLYYGNNSAIQTGSGLHIIEEALNKNGIKVWLEFYLLEVGIYGILLWKSYKKNEIYLAALIALMIVPFIGIGLEYDFSMRVSIPALIVINYYFIQWMIEILKEEKISSFKELWNRDTIQLKLVIACCVFVLGFITPFVEVNRGIWMVKKEKRMQLVADDVVTLEGKETDESLNFVCVHPRENSKFFQYLAK